ncbi:MAG: integrin alpha [candidate division Zixibacteria bacterium]|nr:integrin alpha [candidate division Zixibacteria bacterium]MCI0595111.1 integrin alpha [candidate division Zixibacteria bacterium]
MTRYFRFIFCFILGFSFLNCGSKKSTQPPVPVPVQLYQKDGAAINDVLGISVAVVGDVNGDGKADFIIGAPGTVGYTGSAYVYSGASGALLYQKNGAAVNDFLGNSVAGAGDVNGDGKADFIIGAHLADPGGLVNAGSAYVISIR